jgi:hypothetical protein
MAEIDDMRHGSAAVALRRLTHPERDGRDGAAVVASELSELIWLLSINRPEMMEEIVAFIERRTAGLKATAR